MSYRFRVSIGSQFLGQVVSGYVTTGVSKTGLLKEEIGFYRRSQVPVGVTFHYVTPLCRLKSPYPEFEITRSLSGPSE